MAQIIAITFISIFILIFLLFAVHVCIDTDYSDIRIDYDGIKFRLYKRAVKTEKGYDYILQVKKWWMPFYEDCYWKIEESDGPEYYRVCFPTLEAAHKRGILKNIESCLDDIIFFVFNFPVKIREYNDKEKSGD